MDQQGWIAIGALAEYPEGKPSRVGLDGLDLLVVRRGQDVYVVSNRCTHQGAPLARGAFHAAGNVATITCPVHGSMFELGTGRVLRGPATTPLPTYESRVNGQMVEIREHG